MNANRFFIVWLALVLCWGLSKLQSSGDVNFSPNNQTSAEQILPKLSRFLYSEMPKIKTFAPNRKVLDPNQIEDGVAKPGVLQQIAKTEKPTTPQNKKEDKKKKTKAKIVEQKPTNSDENRGLSSDSKSNSTPEATQAGFVGYPPNTQTFQKKETKTIGQWKSLLLGSPDLKLVTDFLSARQIEEVSENDFWEIVNAMLEVNNPRVQHFGVQLASSEKSAMAFTALADHQETLFIESRTAAEEILLNFSRNMIVLEQVLLGENKRAAITATQVITKSIVHNPNQNTLQAFDGRGARGTAIHMPKSQHTRLTNILEVLSRDKEAALAMSAHEALIRLSLVTRS